MNHILYLTSRCNFSCSYCYERNKISESGFKHFVLSKYEIVKFIFLSKMKDKNPQFIIFGGEPTLYPDLCKFCIDVISVISECSHIVLNTNGFNTSSIYEIGKHYLFRVKQGKNIGLSIEVSYDGLFQNERRKKQSERKILETVKILRDIGIRYNVRMSVLYDDLLNGNIIRNLYYVVQKTKCKKIVINNIYNDLEFKRSSFDNLLNKYINFIVNFTKKYNCTVCITNSEYCRRYCNVCVGMDDRRYYYSKNNEKYVEGDKYQFTF